MARKKFSKEEKKQMRKEQRQKDALRSYRCRGFKNFLFWLTGVLSSVVLIISALFVGVAVVPVRVYLGDNADGIVSYDISSKSLINAFLKANTYDMSDFPVVIGALDGLDKNKDINQFIDIDMEKIKTLKFDESFTTELKSCIKVTATLEKVLLSIDKANGSDLTEKVSKLESISKWEEVEIENLPKTDSDGNIVKDEGSGELKSNPKLYYYYHVETEGYSSMSTEEQEDKVVWERAFDDNGNRVPESVNQTLYYANPVCTPILDLVELKGFVEQRFNKLKLKNILEIASEGKTDTDEFKLISNILGDKTISQIDQITEDITLTNFLPYKDDKVDNSKLYQILLQLFGVELENWEDEEAVKSAAESLNISSFGELNGDGDIKFEKISLSTFELGEEISKILLDAVNGGIKEYNKNLNPGEPLEEELTSVNELTVGHLTTYLNTNYITLSTFGLGEEISQILLDAVNGGIKEYNKNLNPDKTPEEELTSINELTVGHLTTYLNTNYITLSTFGLGEEISKILLDAVNGGIKEYNKNLNPGENPEEELTNINELTVGHLTTYLNTSYIMLSTVMPYEKQENGATVPVNTELYNILLDVINGGKDPNDPTYIDKNEIQISHLSRFDFDGIKLSTVMPKTESNGLLYSVLMDIVNGNKLITDPTYVNEDQITINHLSSFNFDNVKLNTVMPKTSLNEDLYNILVDVTGKDVAEISLSHLSKFDYNNIKLSTVMPKTEDNEALYNILFDITGKSATEITIANLSTFKFDSVKLNSVLPVDKVVNGKKVNESLYKILIDVTGKSAKEITLSDLSDFKYDNIKLSTALPVSSNRTLYDVLFDITGKTADKLNIGDLSTFKFDKVKLTSILPKNDKNQKLYNVLLDVTNKENVADIIISDLYEFDFESLHLSTILDPVKNASLYNVLCDVVKVDKEELKLSHLSSFSVSKIHLKTVLGDKETGNVILDKLIAKDIEISNLANAINGLSLYEIYGQNCFVEVSSGEAEVARYKKQGNSYILDANGEYKISKTAGIWLFLCFDFADEEIDKVNLSTMGCRVKYTIGDATLNSLTEQGSGNNLSKQLTTATIRQLVDAGVLESANPMLYTFTLQDAVKVKQ